MTKSQIKAELRRSACEDYDPYNGIDNFALYAAYEFETFLAFQNINTMRTFFLLVAEAL